MQTLYKTQVRELREEAEEKTRQVVELEEERTSLTHQLQLSVGRADAEALARSIAEETVAELEKEKTVKELETRDLVSRHMSDITEKDTAFNTVSQAILFIFWSCIISNMYLILNVLFFPFDDSNIFFMNFKILKSS